MLKSKSAFPPILVTKHLSWSSQFEQPIKDFLLFGKNPHTMMP